MRFNKKTLLALLAFGVFSTANIAYAEDKNISETITHLEQSAVEAAKSDFNAAVVHIKAARTSSDKIEGHEELKKAGMDGINISLKTIKLGLPNESVVEIKKTIEVYKGGL